MAPTVGQLITLEEIYADINSQQKETKKRFCENLIFVFTANGCSILANSPKVSRQLLGAMALFSLHMQLDILLILAKIRSAQNNY